jgi:hypothetical protein
MGQCKIEDQDFASLSTEDLRKLKKECQRKAASLGANDLRVIRLKIS